MKNNPWLARRQRGCAAEICRHSAPIFALAALFVFAVTSTAPAASSDANDAPVAIVGSETITSEEYTSYLRHYLRSKLYHGGSPERVRELANEALQNLIDKRLLADAATKRGIMGDPKAVKTQIDQIRNDYSGHAEWPTIEEQLPNIERGLLEDSKIQILRSQVSKVADPTEQGLRAFYRENPAFFTQPQSWDLDLILIAVAPSSTALEWAEARQKMTAIRTEIIAGRAFEDLATENSDHESSKDGGRLDRVHRGQLPSEAEAALETMAPTNISDPIRVLEGYVLLRLNARNEAKLQAFDDVRARIMSIYQRERAKTQWTDYLAGLRTSRTVKAYDISALVEKFVAEK